jgi:C4-dicarboxylate transporter DctM subunit
LDSTGILMVAIVVLLIILLLIGMPIAFALGISGFVGISLLIGMGSAGNILQTLPFDRIATYSIVVIPMFVLMGQLAFQAKLSERAYDVGNRWFGRIPGGLGIATMVSGAVFGACCGSTLASGAAIGKVAVPEMAKHGYEEALSAASVASAGLLADLIPPSVGIVIYGIITGESVGRCLIAGIIPGILSAALFSSWLLMVGVLQPQRAPRGDKSNWADKLTSLRGIIGIGVLFLGIFGGMFAGIFTPVEAGSVGAFLALLLLAVENRRAHSFYANVGAAVSETIYISIMNFAVMIGAGIFSYFLTLCRLPIILQEILSGLTISRMFVLVFILFIYLILGMFLDPLSMSLITLPVVYPLIINMGFSGIWFCIIYIKMTEVGCLTPPVGMNVYVVAGVVPGIRVERIFKAITPFFVLEFVGIAIMTLFPQIILWLPNLMI